MDEERYSRRFDFRQFAGGQGASPEAGGQGGEAVGQLGWLGGYS